MFDFIFRKRAVVSAQKFIDKLEPKVSVHMPEDLPLPSISVLKKLSSRVSFINGLEFRISSLTDDQLKAKTDEFKAICQKEIAVTKKSLEEVSQKLLNEEDAAKREDLQLQQEKALAEFRRVKQKTLDDILPEAFAVVREVGKRVLNMRHFDVQLIGGMVLNGGNIAEMTTGEGKTLVATLPAYLNALTGEGVHVVTVNDYLAKRDCEWMGPIYEFLGLSLGVIQHDMMPKDRKIAYRCDITYGTNNEFGFDYLRDNMVNYKEDMVQRPHHFAIVDEVDSILVDEARTPLIISGPAEESTDKYYRANELVKKLDGIRATEKDLVDAKYKEIDLSEGKDYMADEKTKSVSLTDQGEEKAAKLFGIDNLHDMETIEYRHHILQALKAKEFFMPDIDYVVRDGEVIIVDEFTGRMMPGRRWSDGLHQAVEAKEGIKIARENQTLATITFQNYFRLYEKLSGMTGTAYTEAAEFKEIYDLDCMALPTNKKLQRKNFPDVIYKTVREKYNAVVEEIEQCFETGQPVLVGTISIEKSELLGRLLEQKGIKHQVLNAKYHEREAHIIAQAGRFQGVTIATNMAGRGTDIVLGGNAEFLAQSLAEERAHSDESVDQEALTKEFINKFREQVQADHEKVIAQGGLYVLGTERHESRRIDNQLRGRQGRQGDPGASRFFVSLEDDLMRLFASDRIMGLMEKLGMEEGQALEHPWLSNAIETAQRRVEGHNFEIRKHLLEYDNVMNRQREVVYNLRRSVLERENIKSLIVDSLRDVVGFVVMQHLFSGEEEQQWDIDGLMAYLKTTFDFDLMPYKDKCKELNQGEIEDLIFNELVKLYDKKEEDIGVEQLRHVERMLMLHMIDSKWKDHLYSMDQLKEGVGLRSFAQRDPLVEYKREGFSMFQMMYDAIHQEVAETIFKIQAADPAARLKGVFSSVPQRMIHKEAGNVLDAKRQASNPQAQKPVAQKPVPIQKQGQKIGRNDPCSCGSGKKYKKCCGQ